MTIATSSSAVSSSSIATSSATMPGRGSRRAAAISSSTRAISRRMGSIARAKPSGEAMPESVPESATKRVRFASRSPRRSAMTRRGNGRAKSFRRSASAGSAAIVSSASASIRPRMAKTSRRRKAASTSRLSRLCSGSSRPSMLFVSERKKRGIHQAIPGVPRRRVPSTLRPSSTKASLFRTASAAAWVDVVQTRPTKGSRARRSGPSARIAAKAACGSRA